MSCHTTVSKFLEDTILLRNSIPLHPQAPSPNKLAENQPTSTRLPCLRRRRLLRPLRLRLLYQALLVLIVCLDMICFRFRGDYRLSVEAVDDAGEECGIAEDL